jgi:hypothetical protein
MFYNTEIEFDEEEEGEEEDEEGIKYAKPYISFTVLVSICVCVYAYVCVWNCFYVDILK